ncbi:unnamed protein product [Nezara viridula]|uniref:Inositol-1-monophosphatase n=1 Tax=Nezara viridula TaxID=85310 RepID=A0A9P0HI28_NEZVI|nr:unnamed protein product [Nezara viridula]
MKQTDIDLYYKTVMEAVELASKIVLEGFQGTKNVKTKTASWDLVTEYDRKTEELLIKTLSKAFPDHKFIGEETASKTKLTDEPTWIIDPIDGTTNFVHGIPYCCIAIGLAISREIVIGIVCNPALNQTFTAIRGRGAFLNGQPIHVSNAEELKNAVLAFEFSLAARPEVQEVFINRYRALVTKAQGMRSFGCAQMQLCQVASGLLDAYYVEFLAPWDVAAGSLIVTEAGGTVIDTDGGKFDCVKSRLVATGTKKLAEEIVEILRTVS